MYFECNKQLQLGVTPKRIVSLVPSQTELLFDLGLEQYIVGVTKFCVHPNHLLKTKTIIGGTKQLHLDKIKALQPDIILCNKEENTKEIVIECSKIAQVHVSDIKTINDCLLVITQYGKIFNAKAKAEQINAIIKEQLSSFKAFVSKRASKKVIYFIWRKPYMVAGKNTFINELLQLNRFENTCSHLERYPEIILQYDDTIDLVLLSSEPYPFKNKHVTEFKTYYPNAKIILVDGEYFSWYGSRLIKAFDYFKTLEM